jgi:hypothetical protein
LFPWFHSSLVPGGHLYIETVGGQGENYLELPAAGELHQLLSPLFAFDDDGFFAALQELVAYAFEESVRIKKKGRLFPGWHEIPARSSHGILQEVQSLLQKYRSELLRQSRLLDQGGRA